jgi:hypothetical protein
MALKVSQLKSTKRPLLMLRPRQDNNEMDRHHQRRANNVNVMNRRRRAVGMHEDEPKAKRTNLDSVMRQADQRAAAAAVAATSLKLSFGGQSQVLNSSDERLERQENMTQLNESQTSDWSHLKAGRRSLSAAAATTTTTKAASSSAASPSRRSKIIKQISSTFIGDDRDEQANSGGGARVCSQRRQQQLVARDGGQKSKAAVGVSSAWLFSSLPLCLVLFVLSLFLSTTTTLVDGKFSLL